MTPELLLLNSDKTEVIEPQPKGVLVSSPSHYMHARR